MGGIGTVGRAQIHLKQSSGDLLSWGRQQEVVVVRQGPEQLKEVPEGYCGTAAVLVELAEIIQMQSIQKRCPLYHRVVGLMEVLLNKYLGCEHPGHLWLNWLLLRLVWHQVHHSPVNFQMMLLGDKWTNVTFQDKIFLHFLGGSPAASCIYSSHILSLCASQCLHVFWWRLKEPGFFHSILHGHTQV